MNYEVGPGCANHAKYLGNRSCQRRQCRGRGELGRCWRYARRQPSGGGRRKSGKDRCTEALPLAGFRARAELCLHEARRVMETQCRKSREGAQKAEEVGEQMPSHQSQSGVASLCRDKMGATASAARPCRDGQECRRCIGAPWARTRLHYASARQADIRPDPTTQAPSAKCSRQVGGWESSGARQTPEGSPKGASGRENRSCQRRPRRGGGGRRNQSWGFEGGRAAAARSRLVAGAHCGAGFQPAGRQLGALHRPKSDLIRPK